MTAAEARRETLENLRRIVDLKIDQAVKNGATSAQIYYENFKYILEEYKQKGFKISNYGYYELSW